MQPTNRKRKHSRAGTIGIYFSGDNLSELAEIRAEADKFFMQPSDYARRLIRIGRRIVSKDPRELLGLGDN